MEGLKEKIANKIFPFELYLSGKFNHSDIIEAMITMAEIFESFHSSAIISYMDIKSIECRETDNANEEII